MNKAILLDKGKENFLKLKELYLNKATVVPFVGAGPSIPIGIAGWDSLLKKMIDTQLKFIRAEIDSRQVTCALNLYNSSILTRWYWNIQLTKVNKSQIEFKQILKENEQD